MFNLFRRLDGEPQVEITIVENGIEKQVPGWLYRCEGDSPMGTCNLVWDRAYLAKTCGDRGHKQSFMAGNFKREARRRDGKQASVPAPAPAPAAPAPTPLEAAMALVKASGFRISKAPKAKEIPEFEIKDEFPDDLPPAF